MIDPELNAQLRARFNPEGSPLREYQLRIKKIMDVVDKICRENDITYWLSSGTLLGAVRHGGFIPWDDDIDIEIAYKDRARFVKVFRQQLPQGYALQTHATDSAYCINILKVRDLGAPINEDYRFGGKRYPIKYKYRGLFVDIFTEEPSSLALVSAAKLPMRLQSILQYQLNAPQWLVNLGYYAMMGSFALLRCCAKLNPKAKMLYHTYGSSFTSCRNPEDIFPVKDMAFEGSVYKVPNNPDAYLTRMFGDYMQIPDLSKLDQHIAAN